MNAFSLSQVAFWERVLRIDEWMRFLYPSCLVKANFTCWWINAFSLSQLYFISKTSFACRWINAFSLSQWMFHLESEFCMSMNECVLFIPIDVLSRKRALHVNESIHSVDPSCRFESEFCMSMNECVLSILMDGWFRKQALYVDEWMRSLDPNTGVHKIALLHEITHPSNLWHAIIAQISCSFIQETQNTNHRSSLKTLNNQNDSKPSRL
jgi:hypothetical protein